MMGRIIELGAEDLPSIWSVKRGIPNEMPCISNNLELLLRLSERGSIIQKYQMRPFTHQGRKAVMRLSVFLKSVVPL